MKCNIFRENLDKHLEESGKEAKEARVGVDMYGLLRTEIIQSLPKYNQAKHLHTLFGVKILIDPSLKKDEIRITNS